MPHRPIRFREHLLFCFIIFLILTISPGMAAANPGGVASNLQLWLKADSGLIVDGSNNVTNWNDQSGNNRNADIVTSDPQRIDGALNFNPIVRFDGNDYFRFTSSPFVTAFTAGEAFSVLKDNIYTACACGHIFDFGGSSRSFHYTWSNGAIYEGFGTNDRLGWVPLTKAIVDAKAGIASMLGPVVDPRNYHIYSPHSTTNDWGIFFDGTETAITATNTINFTLTGSNEQIGRAGANIFNGDASEIMLYNRVLTASERNQINSYLGLKYGITLDQTSGGQDYTASDGATEIWDKDAPNASTHNNNIAGIGRDDASQLNQKQSKTINTANKAALVTIGLGTIADDNPTNPNSFAADLSFLSWGDNGASAEFELPITAPGPLTANYRTSRVWSVQETGTVGTVKIGVPSNISAFDNTIYLVVSGDTTFDNTDQFVELNPLTVGSTNYLAGDFDFNDEQFFAFASYITPPGGVAEGLEYWIRPESMQLTGNNVTNWDDMLKLHSNEVMIGGGFLFNSVGFNFHPTASTNGDRYMRFDNQHLLSGATAGEVFYMLESTGAHNTNDGYPSEIGGGGSLTTWEYDYSNSNIYSGWGSTTRKNWNPLTAPAGGPSRDILDPHIYNVLSTAGEWTARFNGITNFTTAVNTANFNTSTFGGSLVGASNSSIFKGKLSEMIVFRKALNETERLQVNSYLATKYGTTLGTNSSPSNYIASDGITNFWTGSTTYQNNIAGIGRDDVGTLDQRQSQSSNPTNNGNLITMGLGTIAVDNASNPNSFGSNLNFMMWGDNAASTDFGVPFAPPGGVIANFHMGRIWNVQETGTVGTVKIAIPDSLSTGNQIYLAISNDATFDNTDQYFELSPFTVGSTNYLAEDINFSNGQFFTFATSTTAPGGVGTGLHIWQKANAGTGAINTGDPVNTWLDSSDNGFDAIQTGDPTLQLNQINFNPAVYYDGTADGHNSPLTSQLSGQWTFFGTAQMEGPLNRRVFSSIAANVLIGYWNGRQDVIYLAGNPANHTTGPTATTDPKIYTFTRQTSGATAFRSAARQILTSVTSANPLIRFGIANGGAYSGESSRAYVPEMIMYNAALTAMDINRVESYLALKYGITLDQTVGSTDYTASDGTTEMWDKDAPGASTYENDIAGIGQDITSALLQPKSKSVNTDAIVTIGSSSNLEDLEFLTWGNNNGTVNSFTLTGAPSGYQRVNREWSIQETGDVGTVTIEVDVEDPQLNLANFGPSLFLLYDANNDGNLADETPVQMFDDGTNGDTVGGNNIWTVQGVNFDDGEEFTFAVEAIKVEFTNTTASDTEMSGENLPTLTVGGGILLANQTVSVVFNVGSTATSGTDFSFISPKIVTIPAGNYTTPQTIAIPGLTITDDSGDEIDETIVLDLQSPSAGITIDDADSSATTENQHIYTILDDDTAGAIITVTDDLTSEDGDTGTFQIQLTSQPSADVTIALISDNPAEGSVPASITILAANWNNPAANIVTVTGVDDVIGDGTVSYSIITGNVTSGDAGYNSLDGSTITDPVFQNQNNDPPGIMVTVIDSTTGEDGSTATVQFELLSQPALGDVTIPLSLSDITEGDLGGITQIIILNSNWNNPSANQIIITGINDQQIDGNIIYQLITGDPTSTDPGYDALTATDAANPSLTNVDNDGLVVEFTDATASDAEASGGNLPTLTVSGAESFIDYTVQVADLGTGSTTSGIDYGFVSPTTVTIPAGNYTTPQNINIPGLTINDDIIFEPNETISLQLQNPTGLLTIGDADVDTNSDANHLYTIIDDETSTVSITASDASGSENPSENGEFTITLSSTNNTGSPITVNYAVTGTAANGFDYAPLSGSVDIPDGTDNATITVDTTGFDDALFESDENIIVTLTGTNNVAVTVDSTNDDATVFISDDEYTAGATISISSSGSPAENPLTNGQYTVTLSTTNNTHEPITVTYTVSGTSTNGTDYNTLTGTVDIADGSNSATITIIPVNDIAVESNETVEITLTGASALTVIVDVPAMASLSIISDDIVASSPSGGGGGGGGSPPFGQPAASGNDVIKNNQNTSIDRLADQEFFEDTKEHWAEEYIQETHDKCSINGYEDESGQILHIFKPDNSITRSELLVMVMKCRKLGQSEVLEKPFPDVEITHWAAPWVIQAKALGIINGYTDGNFRPDDKASRAEALKIILLSKYSMEEIDASTANDFCKDLNPGAWYAKYFYFSVMKEIISGYKDEQGNITGICGPTNSITRAESSKILTETFF